MTFDQAQSARLGQRTPVENPGVQVCTLETLPEVAYRGQMVFLIDEQAIGVYDGDAWIVTGAVDGEGQGSTVFVQPTPPVADATGNLWLNTTDYQLYVWNGSVWAASTTTQEQLNNKRALNMALAVGNVVPAFSESEIVVRYQSATPTSATNDFWVNTATNEVYRWDGSAHVPVMGVDAAAILAGGYLRAVGSDQEIHLYYAGTPTGLDAGDIGDIWVTDTIQVWTGANWHDLQVSTKQIAIGAVTKDKVNFTARDINGIATYYQPGQPTDAKIGDFWVDTDDDNKLTRYNGTTWESARDKVLVRADADLATAKTQIDTLTNTTLPAVQVSLGNLSTTLTGLSGKFPVGSTDIQDGAITTPKITVNSLEGDRIAVNTLSGDKIIVNSVTADQLSADAINGKTITGVTINGGTLNIPGALNVTSGQATFTGEINATSAIFRDKLLVLGMSNYVAGKLLLSSGVENPTNAPVVQPTWGTVDQSILPNSTSTTVVRGLAPSVNGNASTDIAVMSYAPSSNPIKGVLAWRDPQGVGQIVYTPDYFTPRGIVLIGTNYYLSGIYAPGGGVTPRPETRVYNSSFVLQSTIFSLDALGDQIALTSNGSNVVSVSYNVASGTTTQLRVATCTTQGQPVSSQTYTLPASTSQDIAGAYWGAMDTGATRLWVAMRSGGVYCFDTSSRTTLSQYFYPLPFNYPIYGLLHDGTRFKIYQATSQTLTTFSLQPGGSYVIGYAWHDNNNAGSGKATSLVVNTTATVPRGSITSVSTPAPPDDGTTDGANTVAVYARLSSASTSTLQSVYNVNERSQVFELFTTNGTAAPTTSGFASRPAATPGELSMTGAEPIFYFTGKGEYRIGPIYGVNKTAVAIQGQLNMTGPISSNSAITTSGVITTTNKVDTNQLVATTATVVSDFVASGAGSMGPWANNAAGKAIGKVGRIAELYSTSAASIANGTVTALPALAYIANTDSSIFSSPSGGVLTLAEDGLYLVTMTVTWAVNTTGRRMNLLYVNNTEVRRASIGASAGNPTVGLAHTWKGVAGDGLTARIFQDSGGALALLGSGGPAPHILSIARLA